MIVDIADTLTRQVQLNIKVKNQIAQTEKGCRETTYMYVYHGTPINIMAVA